MKEYKITGVLRPSSISPIVGENGLYNVIRQNIQRMQNTQRAPLVEIIIRVDDPRQDWIDRWYAEAMTAELDGDIFIKHCKEATIVVNYGANIHDEIACSAPRHGDKYDYKTGIAVAYAKLRKHPIPDFI